METDAKILVTGAGGMVGNALVKRLRQVGYTNLLVPRAAELDLRDSVKVDAYFAAEKPSHVFHLAAKVGGIQANIDSPVDFLVDNLLMNTHIAQASWAHKVKKMLLLGSSCIYPRECSQPMVESKLLTGSLEPTNEGYALGKILGLKLCEYYNKQYGTDFLALMPCNVYGPGDHFEPKHSHVISALILKFHAAKQAKSHSVPIWGTGNVRREFLYVDDLADAILYYMKNHTSKTMNGFVNVGTGEDITIHDLAFAIKDVVRYEGEVVFDPSKPEGMPRKMLDVSKSKSLGWEASIPLKEGLQNTYKWFIENGKEN